MATATKNTGKNPTKQTTTVRISEKAHGSLRELADKSGEPMQTVLDKAIQEYRRQRFLEECHIAYAILEQDPEAIAEYRQEMAAWDVTLMDGLDPNEVWTEDDFVREDTSHA